MVAGDKAALIALVGGKVGKPVCKWYGLGLGFFQTSQEVQPCRGRLDQEFPRPLEEGLHTMAMVLLTSPAIAVWTKSFRDHWRRACTRWRWCCSRVQQSAAASMAGEPIGSPLAMSIRSAIPKNSRAWRSKVAPAKPWLTQCVRNRSRASTDGAPPCRATTRGYLNKVSNTVFGPPV